MKNKNLCIKSLNGIAIGVLVLMLTYISIYFIIGEEGFIAEISVLQNINILIIQIFSIGITYYAVIFTLNLNFELFKDDCKLRENPYRTIALMIVLFVFLIIIIELLIGRFGTFSSNIETLNMIVLLIIWCTSLLIGLIKISIDKVNVNKINKKLNNINK